ncbi:MAG: M20/M25/M40 family metallo-hydrolase [Actinomycetota bacterium]|nr:M20/M25/M40 family metallo-hydrolase [Actinomycetota bacterium]
MLSWVSEQAEQIAARAERELEALVRVSSPSGDVDAAEEAVAVASALLPTEAEIERPGCSSPGYARDLVARVTGSGAGRVVLVGHLDTVVAHAEHRPLERIDGRLVGSGAVDMKGGVVLALGVLRSLASVPDSYAEVALLLVVDEEWRTFPFVHGERFSGYDASLCFEAGERGPGGEEAVIVKRKAAGTLRVRARGVAAHSGSAPDKGRNALLALAAAAQRVAGTHDPDGPDRLTAVPTVMRAGDAFNAVPSQGELHCDLRADSLEAFAAVLEAVPREWRGVDLEAELVRRWPGMDTSERAAGLLTRATKLLGRPVIGTQRGGASDASYLAAHVAVSLDGLGPRGGGAHAPQEFVLADSLRSRAEVALALTAAALDFGEAG